VVVGVANFMWLFVESGPTGKEAGGLHAATLLLTHPLAMAGGAYLLFTTVFPSMVGGTMRRDTSEAMALVRSSGPTIATTRTGGRFGELRLTWPLVQVDVHPGGVVFRLFAMGNIALDAASIRSVVSGRRFGSRTVTISHSQVGVPSDIRLFLADDSAVTSAIRAIADARPTVVPRPGVGPGLVPGEPQPDKYPLVTKVGIILGFIFGIVFFIVSRAFAAKLDTFGIIWSVALLAILAFNAWTYFIKNRSRW